MMYKLGKLQMVQQAMHQGRLYIERTNCNIEGDN
jgi:hypothetical protein